MNSHMHIADRQSAQTRTGRTHRLVRKWHARLGLAVSPLLLMLAVTGAQMNMKHLLPARPVLEQAALTTEPVGDSAVRELFKDLHRGRIVGRTGRIIVSLSGVVCVLVIASGIFLAVNVRAIKKKRTETF